MFVTLQRDKRPKEQTYIVHDLFASGANPCATFLLLWALDLKCRGKRGKSCASLCQSTGTVKGRTTTSHSRLCKSSNCTKLCVHCWQGLPLRHDSDSKELSSVRGGDWPHKVFMMANSIISSTAEWDVSKYLLEDEECSVLVLMLPSVLSSFPKENSCSWLEMGTPKATAMGSCTSLSCVWCFPSEWYRSVLNWPCVSLWGSRYAKGQRFFSSF